MTLVWLTVVIGVFNICLGFALGVYVQGIRSSAANDLSADHPHEDMLPAYPSSNEDVDELLREAAHGSD